MSSPRSLFEVSEIEEIDTVEVIDSEVLVEGKSIESCEEVKHSAPTCAVSESHCHYHQWLILIIALIAIFIIYYFGNRCDNNEWFNKHHHCSWVAYSETINLWWSIMILVLTYIAIRLYSSSCGQMRSMLMILWLLLIVISVLQVWTVLELRNYAAGFWLSLLLLVLGFVLLAYSWKVDQVSSILIILILIWLLYVTAVTSTSDERCHE